MLLIRRHLVWLMLTATLAAGVDVCLAESISDDGATDTDVSNIDTSAAPETAEANSASATTRKNSSAYRKWRRSLPFWPGKLVLLVELSLNISLGVIIGQMLEAAGLIRWLSIITLPLTSLGRLPKAAGPPLLMAFQSGAIANSMLVSYRDNGQLNHRHVYTSVLVVSCLSLFTRLVKVMAPVSIVLGGAATLAFFAVRFGAIAVEILMVLLISSLVVSRWTDRDKPTDAKQGPTEPVKAKPRPPFWQTVMGRSGKTLRRLAKFVIPTFVLMTTLEYFQFFDWLAEQIPGLFSLPFLPPEALVIIPAQATSLINGAAAAGMAIENGSLSPQQGVLTLLVGSIATAPIRTLKRILRTYVSVLGPRAGVPMAISAQVLRVLFMITGILLIVILWR